MAIRNDRDVDTRRDERGWQHHFGDVQRSTSQHDREDRERDDDDRGWFDRVRHTASRWFYGRDEDDPNDDDWRHHDRGTLGRRGDVGVSGRTSYDRYDERGRFTGFAGDDDRRYFGEGSRNRPFGDERNERGRFDRDVDAQRLGSGSERHAGRWWDERDRDREWASSRDREEERRDRYWAERRDRDWADRRERMSRDEHDRIERERERERMARDRDRDRMWRDERERELERERMWREHYRMGRGERERRHGPREWPGRDERDRGDRTPWRADRTPYREDRTPYRGERTPYRSDRDEMYSRGRAYRGGEMFGGDEPYRGHRDEMFGRDEPYRGRRDEMYGGGRSWMRSGERARDERGGGLDRDEYGRYMPGSEEHVEHDDRMRRDERRRR